MDVVRRHALDAAVVTIAGLAPASADTFIVPGTGDGLDLLRYMAAIHKERRPQTDILFPPSVGSQGGKLAVAQGQVPLARAAVPLTAAEEAIGLRSIEIARIPIAFFTHPSIKISSLSAEQLADIFSASVRNWRALGGPDLRIKVVLREEGDSTLQVLRATLNDWSTLVPTDHSRTVFRTHDEAELVTRVEGAIGFGPYSKSLEADFNLIGIDGKYPTSPDYPSFTTVRLVFKHGRLPAELKEFIRFARSAEAARIYEAFGALPIADVDVLSSLGQ